MTGSDTDGHEDADSDAEDDADRSLDLERFQSVVQSVGRPVVTASEAARVLGWSQREAADALDTLAAAGRAERADVADDPTVWYSTEFAALADREHAVVFPDRREVVIEHPEQFTRAQLAQFAHLVDRNDEAYLYRVREEDVWHAPYDGFEDLLGTVRDVLGGRYPSLESWMESQWGRARKFALVTQDDYTVLEAASADLLGNVALGKLEEGDHYRARIDDAQLWVTEGAEGEIKRILYEAGYPVSDERELETGDPLDLELRLELRDYQRDWVDRFGQRGAGVFVGPPGSGKTVAALGAMAEIGGETLVLVPSRELADQWVEAITTHTSLGPDQVGQYHGGEKEIRPVTVATYRTAGMDRHHHLFDNRKWGLIVFDEVHHVSAPVYRRTAELQSRHRLGLSVDGDTRLPVRTEDGVEMRRIESLATDYLDDQVGVASVSGIETLGLTDRGTVEWTPLTAVMRHENSEPLYRVRARNGREVTVTADHSLVVFDGNDLSVASKLPDDLAESDYLLQPSDIPDPAPGSDTVDLMRLVHEGFVLVDEDAPDSVFDPLYERGIADNKSRYNWKTRRNLPLSVAREIGLDREHIVGVYIHGRDSYVPPEVPVDAFARLLGLFVADGALDDHRVEFYATDSAECSEVDDFLEVIHDVCPDADISIQPNGQNCTTLRVSGVLREVLEALGLSNGAREKRVPPSILSNPQAYRPFLEGVVLGDGYHAEREQGREMVTISTSSGELAQGLNLILAHLGHIGGVYRRDADVGVREGTHDTVTNYLVRFNPKNCGGGGRLALTPFSGPLRESYQDIERYGPGATDGGSLDSGLSHRRRLNDEELSTLLERGSIDADWLLDRDVALLDVESVTEVEGSNYVYDVSTAHENFLGNHLFCHNSATPVREDDREQEIFTLIGPPIGTDWAALFDAGFVAEPEVEIRYVPWASEMDRNEYASANGNQRQRIAASNPAKLPVVERLLEAHSGQKTLIFVDWLNQGEALSETLGIPFISGETRHAERRRLFDAFRSGERETLLISRVGDEGIDLPDAEVAIVASGLGGSRRQGSQRAGRTMRPVGRALVYMLATRGTVEEEFVRHQTRHLAGKGVRVTETDAEVEADTDSN